ncbi:MAG: C40 family peptidase [Bacilli bacterium]|nr:C40 family peptidase [Bacilli bacterium]
MKSKLGPSGLIRLVIVPAFLGLGLVGGYAVETNRIYQNLKMTLVDTASVEYGSANYDINKLVDKIDGKIVRIEEDVDTSKVGKQQVVVALEKDGVEKNVAFEVEVKDTKAPEAEIKKEKVSVAQGQSVNVLENVEKVYDVVDGDIEYIKKEEVEEGKTNYYTIEGTVNTTKPGEYPVKVTAVDKYGNVSQTDFKVEVTRQPVKTEEKDKDQKTAEAVKQQEIVNNVPMGDGTLVGNARAFAGYRYRSGGNSPATGFDCSGFVQYILGQSGIIVSRSSGSQAHDGVSIPYASAQPGDILIWGHGSRVTHTAIYLGGGQMMHATNPSMGVVQSNVSAWNTHSDARLIDVRRVK